MARRKRHRPLVEINVVPYIDVMLVLLVIFMVTAPMLQQGIEVNLPSAKAKAVAESQTPPVVVSMNQAHEVFVNQGGDPKAPLTLSEMLVRVAALKRHQTDFRVFVKADEAVPYGEVVSVMSLMQQVGIQEVGLITKPVEQAGAA